MSKHCHTKVLHPVHTLILTTDQLIVTGLQKNSCPLRIDYTHYTFRQQPALPFHVPLWYNHAMFPQMPHRVTNIRRLLTALLLVAVAAGVLLPAVPSLAQGPRLVLAFYYTWFDENTWTSAKVPDFPAETYVSRDPGTMDRHIAQAQGAGIDALVVSW